MGGFLAAGVENWEDELLETRELRGNYAVYEAMFHALESAPDSAMFHRTSKEAYCLVDKGTDDVIDDAVCAVYDGMSRAGSDAVTLKGADRTLYWTVDRAVRGSCLGS